jgi:phage baseplate assembly protein gpV
MQIDGRVTRVWTSLPGILQSFDATKMTASVQPAVQGQMLDPKTGKFENVTISVCLDVPVQFPRGGGYGFTFPLVSGDEGIIVFSARCIDAWWQSSGVQPQAELRMHDLSDGMFIPGISSVPRVPADISTTTARMWSEDGALMVDLDKPNGTITVKAPVKFVVDAPLTHIMGAIAVDGDVSQNPGGGGTVDFGNANIQTTGTIKQGTVVLGTHAHSGVTTGGGNSGPPVP